MSRRGLLGLILAGALAVPVVSADTPKPSCCAKPSKAAEGKAAETRMRCSLTGKTVDKCCCEQKDGKLYCPLAKKTLERCCCEDGAKVKASR